MTATVKTVGDLIRVLSVYDPALPLRFTSAESGGRWPEGRRDMVIGSDESIAHIDATRGGGDHSLEVSLLLPIKPPTR